MESDLGECLRGASHEDLTNEEWPARTQTSPGVATPMTDGARLPGHRAYLHALTRTKFHPRRIRANAGALLARIIRERRPLGSIVAAVARNGCRGGGEEAPQTPGVDAGHAATAGDPGGSTLIVKEPPPT